MIARHTKGPWRAGKHGASIVADCLIDGGILGTDDVEGEGGYLVAETVAKANLPILSAAPEMLDALVMTRDADDDRRRDGLPTIPSAARAKIDAAIAKAMGASA